MILCIFFCCAPRSGKLIFCTFFALFSFSAIPTSPPHGEKHLKIVIFKLILAVPIVEHDAKSEKVSPLAFALRHHDRSPSDRPPRMRKNPSPPPSLGEKSLDSILQTLQQMQTEMTKTSERIPTMESHFEQHSRIFAPSQSYS